MSKSPIKTFKSGPVTASVWENEGKFGLFFRVTLDRRYKDVDGKICYTSSLSPEGVLHAEKALGMAYEDVNERTRQQAKQMRQERLEHPAESPPAPTAVQEDVQASEQPESEEQPNDELDSYL